MSPPEKSDRSQGEIYIHDPDGAATKELHGARTAGSHAAFLLPYLHPGQSLLDIGCGQGNITVGLAEAVAPGEVIGIDMEESLINAARELAKERGVSNVRFEVGNAYTLDLESDSFDAAYSNGVLEHLNRPVDALKETRRVLRSGGIIGVRGADMETAKFAPTNDLIEEHLALYLRYRRHFGGDPVIGRKLRALLNKTGFLNTRFSSSCGDAFGHTTESVKAKVEGLVNLLTGPAVRERVIELGWADNTYFDRVERALREWSESPDVYGAVVWGEAIGWKP